MGEIRPSVPVKLFAGVLTADPGLLADIETRLVDALGPIDHRTRLLPFDATDYYNLEMGDVLDRQFLSFEHLVEAAELARIKRLTNELERGFHGRAAVARPVNIDPGYIEQAKVVLASTKNYYHRIAIGGGVFAEITLHFKNNTYQPLPWTYSDYKSKAYQEFFLRMRQIYRTQLKLRALPSEGEGQHA